MSHVLDRENSTESLALPSSHPAALVGAKYTGPNPRGLTLGYSSDEHQNDFWAREGIHWNRERGCYTGKCACHDALIDLGLDEDGLHPFVGVRDGEQFFCAESEDDGTPSPAATASASGAQTPSFAADDLCATLEFVADYTERIDALSEQIEEARTTRNLGKHAAMIAIGRDMIAKGQKSKTLFGYTIRAGVNVVRLCACHGAYLGDCTTDGGPVHVIVRSTGEPWISVRRNKAAA